MNNLIYIARFIVETATPIAVGSGQKGLTVDRLIARDANGLPYIPGSSLAGVIRHEVTDGEKYPESVFNKIFGFEDKEEGQGSRIFFSSAHLVAEDGKTTLEGIQNIDFEKGYYSFFNKLPERDHVKITDKGVAEDRGKFDEQLVHKGTRFSFELELVGTEADKEIWEQILQTIHAPFFRIGAGTRNGFGQLKIKECRQVVFDLNKESGLLAFLNKSSSLNNDCSSWETFTAQEIEDDRWEHIKVLLQPENFFLFGAGFGDEDADMKPKIERYFDWESGSPKLEASQEHLLIPATSVKGAIAHRVAYHYNILQEVYRNKLKTNSDLIADFNPQEAIDVFASVDVDGLSLDSKSTQWETIKSNIENMSIQDFFDKSNRWGEFMDTSDINKNKGSISEPTQENNEAVRTLFGYAKTDKDGARGKVIFSDVYLKKNTNVTKVFSHVAIDRFTSGGIDGALYQEKAVTSDAFELNIFVEKSAFEEENIKKAMKRTLDDLVNGQLQLGGNTTKGHGAFTGSYNFENI
jgi:CRISPR/Cas system CSM-associated protein Csm3 (group 7 of RAMP superfamily)